MKTYYVFSDVHGFYDELMEALNEKGFDINNPEHNIISLGDATDRGNKPKEVLEFLLDMYDKERAILVRGNHCDLMEEALARGYFEYHDIHNCTDKTCYQLNNLDYNEVDNDEAIYRMEHNELWNKYINSLVDYAEIGNNIFVHGWIPLKYDAVEDEFCLENKLPKEYWPIVKTYNPDWRNASDQEWKDARWYNGMKYWSEGIVEEGKTIFCGHYHVSWGNSHLHNDGKEFLDSVETFYIDPDTGKTEPHETWEPFIDKGICAIDRCTAYTGKVNVVVIEEK